MPPEAAELEFDELEDDHDDDDVLDLFEVEDEVLRPLYQVWVIRNKVESKLVLFTICLFNDLKVLQKPFTAL